MKKIIKKTDKEIVKKKDLNIKSLNIKSKNFTINCESQHPAADGVPLCDKIAEIYEEESDEEEIFYPERFSYWLPSPPESDNENTFLRDIPPIFSIPSSPDEEDGFIDDYAFSFTESFLESDDEALSIKQGNIALKEMRESIEKGMHPDFFKRVVSYIYSPPERKKRKLHFKKINGIWYDYKKLNTKINIDTVGRKASEKVILVNYYKGIPIVFKPISKTYFFPTKWKNF